MLSIPLHNGLKIQSDLRSEIVQLHGKTKGQLNFENIIKTKISTLFERLICC